MKFLIPISILFFGLASCQTNENTITDKQVDVEVEEDKIDTSVVDETVEEVEPEVTTEFNTFDDYFAISTKEELVEKFPKESLKDDISWYGEGEVSKLSTILTNPVNGQVVKYVWSDDDTNEAEWIEANYFEGDSASLPNKGLTTKSGLSLGMSLFDLQEWNEKPLKFLGFGWDYSGSVMVDKEDRLNDSPIQINLGFDDFSDENNFLIGDVTLNSNDEKVKDKGIYVNELVYYYDKLNE
jgi:hypothetical protein